MATTSIVVVGERNEGENVGDGDVGLVLGKDENRIQIRTIRALSDMIVLGLSGDGEELEIDVDMDQVLTEEISDDEHELMMEDGNIMVHA